MLRRRDAWVDDLARVPIFAGCSKREIGRVARHIDRLRFDSGSVVVRQGSEGREFFVIDEGAVDVVEDERVVATLGPGEHFGELATLTDGVRSATVVATTPLRVLTISGQSLRELITEIPGLRERLEARAAERRGER